MDVKGWLMVGSQTYHGLLSQTEPPMRFDGAMPDPTPYFQGTVAEWRASSPMDVPVLLVCVRVPITPGLM